VKKSVFRQLLTVMSVLLALILLGWGAWPLTQKTLRRELLPAAMQLPAIDESSAAPRPAIPGGRILTLRFPENMRVGEAASARLILSEEQPAALQFPDIFQSHNVLAEARLELPGLKILPANSVRQPLRPGQPAIFYWSIIAAQAGRYEGKAWFYLTFLSLSDGSATRLALSAQPVEIVARGFLGLPAAPTRALGLLGSILGAVLGFPILFDAVMQKKTSKVSEAFFCEDFDS